MARSIAATPANTAVIRIGVYYYPVILRPENGPSAYTHCQDDYGAPLYFTRRYAAVQLLWRREREHAEYGEPQGPLTAPNRLYEIGEEPWEE